MSNLANERLWTVQEVADLWGVSPFTVRSRFRNLEGVMRTGASHRPRIRIPERLLRQVMEANGYRTEPLEEVPRIRKTRN